MDRRLFLAMFLLSQARPLSSTSTQDAACQENFRCGNFSFAFPFTKLSNYNCGLCMVDCSNQSFPKIALQYPAEAWAEAKSIEYSNSIIRLNSPGIESVLENRRCELFYVDIRFPNSPSISFKMLNSITFFRCQKNPGTSKNINDSFRGYNSYGSCPDFILYYKYPNSSSNSSESVDLPCSAIDLPFNTTFSQDHDESAVPDVFRLVAAEVNIQWHLSEDCHACRDKGGVCRAGWSNGPPCAIAENSLGTGKKKLAVILGIGAAAGGMGLLTCFLIYFYKLKKSSDASILILRMKRRKDRNIETLIRQHASLAPKRYTYSDIKKMTNSFKNKLGQGGYGTVYKGELLHGHPVAVKILNVANGNDEDFINEVLSISRTSHVNVVKLVGFCVQWKRRALVYECMPNGSLEKYIHAQKDSKICFQLGMEKLYQISLGVARGLEYLHRGCNTRILHFDIKPHNILLDEDFCPKISDFGLAKQCTNNDSAVSVLGARGTIGYIAPELISRCFGVVSYKSDVYSYGMMILEIVGRRKNVNVKTSNASEIYFPHWAYQHLVVEKDLRMKGVVTPEEDEIAKKIILVGLWCIQKDPSHRPTMSKVIEMLEGRVQGMEIPPKPFFGSPSTSPQASFNAISEITSTPLNS